MLIHHLTGRTSEWCLASHHYPERYPKRVQIRTDVHTNARKLLWTRKLGCADEAPVSEVGLTSGSCRRLCQTEVNYLDRELRAFEEHQVGGFEIAVDQSVRFGGD